MKMKKWSFVLPLLSLCSIAWAQPIIQHDVPQVFFTPPVTIPTPAATPGKPSTPAPAVPPGPAAVCVFGSKLPADIEVFSASGYSGRNIQAKVDQSGSYAHRVDVVVNYAEKPVALVLNANASTAWNVSWTQGTRIVALVALGNHGAVVAGIEKSTATIISNGQNGSPCHSRLQGGTVDELIKLLFGKDATSSYRYDEQGAVYIGIPFKRRAVSLISSKDNTIESYIGKNLPRDGQAGLDDAERAGVLRKITLADLEAWDAAVAKRKGQPRPALPPGQQRKLPERTYMILKPFTFPARLSGDDSATFYLAKGVPRPTGDPGHSALGDFNQFP